MTTRSALIAPGTAATALIDVVGLVMQVVWADMRRSAQPIEPTQWATLRLMRDGPQTVSELARQKAVSLPTISKSVDMLVRRGWAERAAGEADRRHTMVRLTPEGHAILAECRRHMEDLIAAKLEALSDGERDALAAALHRLREILR